LAGWNCADLVLRSSAIIQRLERRNFFVAVEAHREINQRDEFRRQRV